ncbi:MAG: hypothetical protein ACLTMP_03885 [Eggerthella lenta]
MHDVRLLLWLSAPCALGSEPNLAPRGRRRRRRRLGKRAYQLYAVGIMLVCALMAAALVDAIQGLRRPRRRRMLARGSGALLAVALVLLRVGIAGARDAVEAVASRHSLSGGQRGERAGARGRVGRSASFRRRGCRGGARVSAGRGVGERVRTRGRAGRWRSQVRRWLRLRLRSAGS